MALITLEEAAAHLGIDWVTDGASPPTIIDERLPDVELKMTQAEAIILEYIDMDEEDLSATGVSQHWLPVVQSAVLLTLSALFDDRDGTGPGDYLNKDGAIARLLRRIRYPSIA